MFQEVIVYLYKYFVAVLFWKVPVKKLLLLVLPLIVSLLAACSSTPPAPVSTATPTATMAQPSSSSSSASSSGAAGASMAAQALPPHLDKSNPLYQQRSVYFDYDVFTIKNEYVSVIERHAKYLSANPSLQVVLEGNADERGGREYNLALGQKRAEAVKNALRTFGVREQQMEAISFGAEKPRQAGHDEQSWAENRRVDFVYKAK